MKKKILLIVAVVALLTGCGKTIPTLSNGEEAVVSFLDGSMISVNELYDKLKDSYATQILIEMIDTKILSAEYEDKLEDAEEYAKSYISSLKTYYVDEDGNYDEATLLSAINQYYGYSTLDEFQEGVKLNYLRNLAIDDYAKGQITDKEIEKYYKSEIVGDREVYHIQIIPDVTTTMTDDEKTEAENEALNEAKSIIAKLKKGEVFEDLASEYSDDEATKEDGGNLGFINKGDYGSDEFDNEVYSLEIGAYSTTPVKTTKGYEIIYVKSENEKAELEDVKDEIIETLANEKLEADATLQITALTELREKYGVDIVDSEIDKDYKDYVSDLLVTARSQNAQ